MCIFRFKEQGKYKNAYIKYRFFLNDRFHIKKRLLYPLNQSQPSEASDCLSAALGARGNPDKQMRWLTFDDLGDRWSKWRRPFSAFRTGFQVTACQKRNPPLINPAEKNTGLYSEWCQQVWWNAGSSQVKQFDDIIAALVSSLETVIWDDECIAGWRIKKKIIVGSNK